MPDEKRVVLVKPGDILLIGNAGAKVTDLGMEYIEAMSEWFDRQGVTIAVFEADIKIDSLPKGETVDVQERRHA